MQQIEEPHRDSDPGALWQLAFRPGFLCAAAFAVFGMSWWLAWLEGLLQWNAPWSPLWWHAHEMLFGFAMPVVVGFLLTAVATWTGIPGSRGAVLVGLFTLWAIARICLLLPFSEAMLLAAICDTLFILWACVELSRRVLAVRQARNYLFIPLLLLFAALNLLSYNSAGEPLAATRLHYAVLLLFLFLIGFVGGRVIPFFTANRLKLQQPPILPWLDYGGLGLLGLLVILTAMGQLASGSLWIDALLWAAVVFHLARLWRWWDPGVLAVPLLWALHLSYLFIPLGLATLATTLPNPAGSTTALHLLAVGGMAGMILAMIARVSLGHTGRPLEVGGPLIAAFAMIALAALLRGLLPLFAPGLSVVGWRLSGALWIAAYAIFLWRYIPVLTRPRPDGKPG